MKDLSEVNHFETSEQLVNVLMHKTQNFNPLFFRVMVAYYFAKLASMMRVSVKTHDRGEIPVNMYAVNLAPSGYSKGFSTNIIEDEVINGFRKNFTENTMVAKADKNIAKLAVHLAGKYNIDEDIMLDKLHAEYESLGTLLFSFDSATSAAVKQLRQKLLMANAGSLNLEMDEIGSNLLGNSDALNTFLELYDVGKVKPKLVKNTKENQRGTEIHGRTPTNMMLYGTPSKLLSGGKVEDEFRSMLETGYARRCLFGFSKAKKNLQLSAEEIYDNLTNTSGDTFIKTLSNKLITLAGEQNFNVILTMSRDVSILLLQYKLNCERLAEDMKDHQEIEKAELSHRYFKALKLAGAYAFIDNESEITEDILYSAIKLVEESGEAFKQILTKDRPYERLAKYLVNMGKEVTQVDLMEDLPFYRGSESQRRDMINLSIAYGYKNNIVIKKTFSEGIEFLSAESMAETDLTKLLLAYSDQITEGYTNDTAPWERLHELVTLDDYHYTAHHFKNGYRTSSNAIQGFNLAIIDVDSGISLSLAKKLLSGYKALYATTKRHTEESNRFRIIFPLSHEVKLTAGNYTKFMKNIYEWLPFEVDDQTSDISRKWCTHNGEYEYQEGNLLDAMLFIPETKKQEEQSERVINAQGLNNLERWFLLNTSSGNRSNMLIRYTYALIDQGYSIDRISDCVINFNKQLKEPLDEIEIHSTIMVSAAKEIAKREINK